MLEEQIFEKGVFLYKKKFFSQAVLYVLFPYPCKSCHPHIRQLFFFGSGKLNASNFFQCLWSILKVTPLFLFFELPFPHCGNSFFILFLTDFILPY